MGVRCAAGQLTLGRSPSRHQKCIMLISFELEAAFDGKRSRSWSLGRFLLAPHTGPSVAKATSTHARKTRQTQKLKALYSPLLLPFPSMISMIMMMVRCPYLYFLRISL